MPPERSPYPDSSPAADTHVSVGVLGRVNPTARESVRFGLPRVRRRRHCAFALLLTVLAPVVLAEDFPRIECDAAMLSRARARIAAKREPFHTYWQLARGDVASALALKPAPEVGGDSLRFHHAVQKQGTACRLLAYAWRLEGSTEAGAHAIRLLDAWASASPPPGTRFDPAVRYPNSGMDVARGMLPFIAAHDLLAEHPSMTREKRRRIEAWFRSLVEVVKTGIERWEKNDNFGQPFQNHHAAHTLGLVLFGAILDDDALIELAVDSPANPRDFRELIAGLILMPGDTPHGGLRGKPLHAGEIQDRYRTNEGSGLIYCHLTLALLVYTAEVLERVTGKDWIDWKAPGGEHLKLSAAFYSDFFRRRSARLHGDYYFRDQRSLGNSTPFLGLFEVALHHWPDVPNLKALVGSMNRARIPRSWTCYYGLPLLTHGVDGVLLSSEATAGASDGEGR